MRRVHLFVLALLAVGMIGPTVQGQEVQLVRIQIEADTERQTVAMREFGDFVITVRDVSDDSPDRLTGGGTGGATFHTVDFEAGFVGSDGKGWILTVPAGYQSSAGDERQVLLRVLPTTTIEDRAVTINFTATITGTGEPHTQTVFLFIDTPGVPALTPNAGSLAEPLRPREIRDASVTITNSAPLPRLLGMELEDASGCGLTLVPSNDLAVGPKESIEMTFSIQAPSDKLWYLSEDCPIRVRVYDINDPTIEVNTVVGATVNGFYVDPVWMFWTLAVIVAAIILFLLLKRRKEALEEEILGKPQKPWTIPVERVYLEHLEEADERAAYVVRHFLMEEEYQSALLWYKSYKKATRGQRAKERVVVRQENKYKRFQKKWETRIAQPMKAADRFEGRLQKKLDRKAKKGVRKDRRKWKKLVAKMESAHEKKKARAVQKWEKSAKRAQKKGEEVPPRPEVPAPDYPPEPTWERVALADHKWQKKADKFRAKMVKKQGDLEVKYEKKEARLLAKLQRKVRRIARRLDDPDFEREHPIVGQKAQT